MAPEWSMKGTNDQDSVACIAAGDMAAIKTGESTAQGLEKIF